MAVLTNKPARISTDIVNALGLGQHFFRVYGGDSFGEKKKPHPAGIYKLREEAGVLPAHTWMIGDSGVDVQTARNAGVPCCGVSWGFQPEAFRDFPPDRVITTPRELCSAINCKPVPGFLS
jgi:phosphoglycolate phosphatase